MRAPFTSSFSSSPRALTPRRFLAVHRRNVVFFKNQKEQLTDAELKTLARKLGQLTGGEGRLHIHPTEIDREDKEISPIKATELCVLPLSTPISPHVLTSHSPLPLAASAAADKARSSPREGGTRTSRSSPSRPTSPS